MGKEPPTPLESIILELDESDLVRTGACLDQILSRVASGLVPSGIMDHVLDELLDQFPKEAAVALLSTMLTTQCGMRMLFSIIALWLHGNPSCNAEEFVPLVHGAIQVVREHTQPRPMSVEDYHKVVVRSPF